MPWREGEPRVGVIVAVRDTAGRILLVRRRNPPSAGMWGFPGGKPHLGETLADCAARELVEETGITARIRHPLTALDALERDPATGAIAHHFVLVAMLAVEPQGTCCAADDALDAGWFALDALPEPLIERVREVAALMDGPA
ncbi:MAG: NUDIX hydrolase [Caenispirillum bisanense]|nr:NUDIX hydrolase [Caenispirillum bisanense]MCA1973193.1 NUDIX hydrolase [Caenispirillum sp.]